MPSLCRSTANTVKGNCHWQSVDDALRRSRYRNTEKPCQIKHLRGVPAIDPVGMHIALSDDAHCIIDLEGVSDPVAGTISFQAPEADVSHCVMIDSVLDYDVGASLLPLRQFEVGLSGVTS
jgi:hypothetical protein